MEITIFALPVILAGFLASSDKILSIFLICFLFGGTATMSLSALGNAPILPSVLFLPFVVWNALNDKSVKNAKMHFSYPNAGFWLTLLVFYEALSAYMLPRLFSDDILVYAANRGAFSGVRMIPLKPVSTNLTQSIYSIFGLITFFATSMLLSSSDRLIAFRNGVMTLASLNIVAALIQIAETYLGLPPILVQVRNADYAMFGNYEVGGLMRIQGTFPETSGFSGFTLPLFAFTLSLFRYKSIPTYSGSVALLTLILLVLSTSTTAYYSLSVYLICIFFMTISNAFINRKPLRLGKIAGLIWLCMVVSCILLLINPDILTRIISFLNVTIINKLDSESGQGRTAWNKQGLINVIDTFGLGVGFGSNRSSNFFVALISNVGLLGTSLFTAFMWKIAASQEKGLLSADATNIIKAAKHAMVITLIGLFASGAFAEPGMMFYVFAAVAGIGAKLTLSGKTMNAISASTSPSFVKSSY